MQRNTSSEIAEATCRSLPGKPLLMLPHLEQQMLAARVRELGAGIEAPADKPKEMVAGLERLLASTEFTSAAQKFGHRYRDFDATSENDDMVRGILELK